MKKTESLSPSPGMQVRLILCLMLVFLTLAAYWPIKNYPFTDFDDSLYVSENHHVQEGLTLKNVIWAFTPASSPKDEKVYWHPLTWLSHMTDCQMFGLNAGYHHLTSLFIHILSVLILFSALNRMTGSIWKSAFVAALFAIHPINVDSVAWISERKNVLSTLFWMLTMLVYTFYAEKPSIARYTLIVFFFTLGLLSKPMLVTLPFTLLLLDFWPLYRIQWGQKPTSDASNPQLFSQSCLTHLILEKIPLIVLAGGVIWLSLISLQSQAQILNTAVSPMPLRIENAIVSYFVYLRKLFWPLDLAIFYPYPRSIPLWKFVSSLTGLIVVTLFVLKRAKESPYLVTGWFWFTGTLVPVSGLVQGGLWPALADRWAYVPMIGMFMVITWGISEILSNRHIKISFSATGVAAMILLLFCLTRTQTGYWKNNYVLFQHALDVTADNYIAYFRVGRCLAENNKEKEAKKYFQKAIEINPLFLKPLENMGQILADEGNHTGALKYYFDALMLAPDKPGLLKGIGDSLFNSGKAKKSIPYYESALRINPRNAELHNNLGVALFFSGDTRKAIREYKNAIRLIPEYTEAYYNMGLALEKLGESQQAKTAYTKAIKLEANYAEAHKSLAAILFREKKLNQALVQYKTVLRITPEDATTAYNIGAILFMANRMAEASGYFKKAIEIDPGYKKAKNTLIMINNTNKETN